MWNQFKEALLRYDYFLLFSHQSPDGDAIGSLIAMQRLLRHLNKQSVVILEAEVSDAFRGFVQEVVQEGEQWIVFDRSKGIQLPFLKQAIVEEVACVWLDFHDEKRLGSLGYLFEGEAPEGRVGMDFIKKAGSLSSCPIFCIDHHQGENLRANYALHDASMSSAAALVYKLYKHLGYELDFLSAQGLYLSVASDTRQFSVSSTRTLDMMIAQECLQTGVHPRSVFSKMQVYYDKKAISMLAHSFTQARYECDGKLCMVILKMEDSSLTEVEFLRLPTEWLHRICRQIMGVEVWVIIQQIGDQRWKISMRSHESYQLDRLCKHWLGGGHACAAGATLMCRVDKLESQLISQVVEHCSKGSRK